MSVGRIDHADPLLGRVLAGRYRIESLLGVGAMGAVYRARTLGEGGAVAVKVLHPGRASDPMLAERFDREALAGAKLDHPNCVRVLDAGTSNDGLRFLVMPLLEGSELRGVMDAGPMPLSQVVELALDVLHGLDHAHRLGLVHRDVKPENVFVVRETDGHSIRSRAKLVDFGLVKLLEAPGGRGLTRAGMVFGTPWYMSPEQASGGIVDARADLYAVGAMMHEMLSGKPPFDADETAIVLRMHMLADPPALPASVPAPIAAFVRGLMAKQAKDRPASAAEAARTLKAAASAGRSSAAPVHQSTPRCARELPGPAVDRPRTSSTPRARPAPVVDDMPPASLLTATRYQGRLLGIASVVMAAVMALVFVGLSSRSTSTPDAPSEPAAAAALAQVDDVAEAEEAVSAPTPTADAPSPPDAEPAPAPPAVDTVALADTKPTTPKTTAPTPKPPEPKAAETKPQEPRSTSRPRRPSPRPTQKPAPRPEPSEPVIHLRPRTQPQPESASKLPSAGRSAPRPESSRRTHLQPRRPARNVAST